MNCSSNETTVKGDIHPFTYHSDGFYKIGLVGDHTNVHTLVSSLATYLKCDTVVLALPNDGNLPENYHLAYSSMEKIILIKSCELNEIQKIVNSLQSVSKNVVTIYKATRYDDAINFAGNLICIYDSYVPMSINKHNIIMPKNCPYKIKKKVHEYCSATTSIRLLSCASFCFQLSNIRENNVMVVNSNASYECNFKDDICIKVDTCRIQVNPIIYVFDKIDKPNKSIMLCGARQNGKSTFIMTYIKYMGKRYDKCIYIAPTDDPFTDYIADTGCTYMKNPDIGEIVSFAKSDGRKLLIFDDCYYEKSVLTLYKMLVCNRHRLNLTIILATQMANSDIIRLNHDHFVLFNTNNMDEIKQYHSLMGNYYPSFDIFRRDFQQTIVDFNAMVINKIDTPIYYDKTFIVHTEYHSLSNNIDVKFAPHKLSNIQHSIQYSNDIDYKNKSDLKKTKTNPGLADNRSDCSVSSIDDRSERSISVLNDWSDCGLSNIKTPCILLCGPLNKCFRIFNSYSNYINNSKGIKECHVFVSPEVDDEIIEELADANYLIHHGYDILDLMDVVKCASESGKSSTYHICIVLSCFSEHMTEFIKSGIFREAVYNGRSYNTCITVINPTEKNILIPPIRAQFEFIATTYTSNREFAKSLYNHYFSHYSKFTTFINDLDLTHRSDNKLMALCNNMYPRSKNGSILLQINEQPLNKFNEIQQCNVNVKNNLDKCFAELDDLVNAEQQE